MIGGPQLKAVTKIWQQLKLLWPIVWAHTKAINCPIW